MVNQTLYIEYQPDSMYKFVKIYTLFGILHICTNAS